MPRQYTNEQIETIKEPLRRVRDILKKQPRIPFTAGNFNRLFLITQKNQALDELKKTINLLLVCTPESIEQNITSLQDATREFKKRWRSHLEKEPEGWEHITEFFRALGHVIDRWVTWARGAEKTYAETYTPGAQTLTGKLHFFNKLETPLAIALKDFEAAYHDLEDLQNDTDNTPENLP